jgi:hypothetical protein
MDDNTLARLAALEQVVCSLQAPLDTTLGPRPAGQTICLKEAAARSGVSRATMRCRALADNSPMEQPRSSPGLSPAG